MVSAHLVLEQRKIAQLCWLDAEQLDPHHGRRCLDVDLLAAPDTSLVDAARL